MSLPLWKSILKMDSDKLTGDATRIVSRCRNGTTRRTRAGAIASCVLLAVALGAVGCDKPPEVPPEKETTARGDDKTNHYLEVEAALMSSGRISTSEVLPFTHAGANVISGEVSPAPDGEAEVGSLVAGRVASLEAVEGAAVKKGQVLAWIDSPEIGSVRADLVRAAAQVSAAGKRLERQLALQSQQATSQGAVDDARAAVQSAEADRQAARAKLNSAGGSTGGSTGAIPLRSPIDGIITERHAMLGGAVAPDTTLFRVVNLATLRVRAQWSETLGTIPTVGTSVRLSPRQGSATNSAPTCGGTVETHLGTIAAATRSVTVQILPDPSCPGFTPGAYLDVIIDGTSVDSAAAGWTQVPLEAVVDLRGLPTVFVAGPELGQFEARRVSPKPSVGSIIPIETGLSPGEKVAVKGVILLKGEALRDILGGD